MSLFKKIVTKILWGLVLGVGYVFLVNLFLSIIKNEGNKAQAYLELFIELCFLGFFTGLISAVSSKPFKATKIIYCSLIGIVGFGSMSLFGIGFMPLTVIFVFPLFLFVPFLLIAIVIGIIDKSLLKTIIGSIGALVALAASLILCGLMQDRVFVPFIMNWYNSHPVPDIVGFSAIMRDLLLSNISYPMNWIVSYYDIFIAGIFYIFGIGICDFLTEHKKR